MTLDTLPIPLLVGVRVRCTVVLLDCTACLFGSYSLTVYSIMCCWCSGLKGLKGDQGDLGPLGPTGPAGQAADLDALTLDHLVKLNFTHMLKGTQPSSHLLTISCVR